MGTTGSPSFGPGYGLALLGVFLAFLLVVVAAIASLGAIFHLLRKEPDGFAVRYFAWTTWASAGVVAILTGIIVGYSTDRAWMYQFKMNFVPLIGSIIVLVLWLLRYRTIRSLRGIDWKG